MKKLLLVLLFVPLISFGQNGFNYQAIISNSDGTVVASQSISVRFSVIYDSQMELLPIQNYIPLQQMQMV